MKSDAKLSEMSLKHKNYCQKIQTNIVISQIQNMVKLEEDTDWSYTALPSLSKYNVALLSYLPPGRFFGKTNIGCNQHIGKYIKDLV